MQYRRFFLVLAGLCVAGMMSAEDIPAPVPRIKPAPQDVLCLVLIAALLGATGQAARALLDWIKINQQHAQQIEQAIRNNLPFLPPVGYPLKRLLMTVSIAFILGAIAGIIALTNMKEVDLSRQETLLAFVAAGYAGTDFIETVLKRWMP